MFDRVLYTPLCVKFDKMFFQMLIPGLNSFITHNFLQPRNINKQLLIDFPTKHLGWDCLQK